MVNAKDGPTEKECHMYRRLILVISAMFLSMCMASALTPVEELVPKYGDVKGARNITVRGARMALARPVLRTYPVAPIADFVEDLAILKLERASEQVRQDFEAELSSSLEGYQYCGKHLSKDGGIVDVYILLSSPEAASQMVVFNPEICALNILNGVFPVEILLTLKPVSSSEPQDSE